MSWFLGHRAYGILVPRPGIEPAPSALEGEVLTTGPAGKSLNKVLKASYRYISMRDRSAGRT